MADRKQVVNVSRRDTSAVERPDRQRLLEPERLLRQHADSIGRTYLPALAAIEEHYPAETKARLSAIHRRSLQRMLDGAAPMPTLLALQEVLDAALIAAPNESVVEACLAALIDTRVKLPHNLPAYLEALIYDLMDEGFPPAVVAAACQRVRREHVFLPEISEVLNSCRETLEIYRKQRRLVVEAIFARGQAERWLDRLPAVTLGATAQQSRDDRTH